MNNNADDKSNRKPLNVDRDAPGVPRKPGGTSDPHTYEELAKASQKEGGFLSRLGSSFQEMLQTSRGSERPAESAAEAPDAGPLGADDLAMRRAKNVTPKRMIVPEGVIIGGPMTSSAETEISGRVDGDVTVDGRLFLGPTALISGNVRAVMCKVEGLIEGKLECSQEIELSQSGRLNADAVAGKKITVAGHVRGSVSTGGILRLVASGRVEGNIYAKQLVIEEGAVFNGSCSMRAPAQRSEK